MENFLFYGSIAFIVLAFGYIVYYSFTGASCEPREAQLEKELEELRFKSLAVQTSNKLYEEQVSDLKAENEALRQQIATQRQMLVRKRDEKGRYVCN